MSTHAGALEAIDRILNRGGDADEVLEAVVEVLSRHFDAAGIRFLEDGELHDGPRRGDLPADGDGDRAVYPVAYEGLHVADIVVAPADAAADPFLARVATLVSPYCLVGWDTGGETWDP